MAITKEDVIKFIEGMTVLELSELVKELETKFGVSAAAPVAMVAASAGGAAPAAAAEENLIVRHPSLLPVAVLRVSKDQGMEGSSGTTGRPIVPGAACPAGRRKPGDANGVVHLFEG
jgi:ribosomal protein L7/L12